MSLDENETPVDPASELGKRLLSDILSHLDSWAGKTESQQQAKVDDLRALVSETIREAQRAAYAGDYPACPATLEGASIKGQITARITIPKQALARHDLLDAVGSSVILVIANPEAYLAGIKDVRARAKQQDLFPESKTLELPGLDKTDGNEADTDEPGAPPDPTDIEDNWVAESFASERNVASGKTRVSTKALAEQLVDKIADYNARTDVQSIGFNPDEIRKQDRPAILDAIYWLDLYINNPATGPLLTPPPTFLHPPKG